MKIVLNNNEYEMVKNYRDGFNLEDLTNRFEEYFSKYDYILGDYAYGKLRLKGFYKKDHKELTENTDYQYLDQYLKEYCAYECKYFVIVKKNS